MHCLLAPLGAFFILLSAQVASAEWAISPPAGYVFKGKASITYKRGPFRCPLGGFWPVWGCAYVGANPCPVYVTSTGSKKFRNLIRIHELAHCAGWPAHHPGGRWVNL